MVACYNWQADAMSTRDQIGPGTRLTGEGFPLHEASMQRLVYFSQAPKSQQKITCHTNKKEKMIKQNRIPETDLKKCRCMFCSTENLK
jgi:hypothetical protein